MKSYVIMRQSGQFDDFGQEPIRVSDDKKKAEILSEQLNQWTSEWGKEIEVVSTGKWYMKYTKENPEPEYYGNHLYYEFRNQLNYIVSMETVDKEEMTYKDAYELYEKYDFSNTAFRKYRKKKPSYEVFIEWRLKIDESEDARNAYFDKMESDRVRYIEEVILSKFPEHLRDIFRECNDGYAIHFEVEEVERC